MLYKEDNIAHSFNVSSRDCVSFIFRPRPHVRMLSVSVFLRVSVGECKIPRYSSRIKFSECWECRYLLRSGLLVSKISSNETLILPDWEAGDARNVTRRGGSLELSLRLRDPGAVRVCVTASGETWYLSQHYLIPALAVWHCAVYLPSIFVSCASPLSPNCLIMSSAGGLPPSSNLFLLPSCQLYLNSNTQD